MKKLLLVVLAVFTLSTASANTDPTNPTNKKEVTMLVTKTSVNPLLIGLFNEKSTSEVSYFFDPVCSGGNWFFDYYIYFENGVGYQIFYTVGLHQLTKILTEDEVITECGLDAWVNHSPTY